MKAVVLYGKEDVRVADFPEKPVGTGDVRIKVAYCGICGSDLHKFDGKKNTHPIHYPVPLGHEISGTVVEVGSAVTGFKPGDRVTADPNWSCGKCRWCQAGKPSFCENARGVVKGMAQYVVSPEENVYHLPDSLSLQAAALTEPVSCCLHGMDLLGLRQGETAAVVGFGAIGAIMMQLLLAAGAAAVYVVEADPNKRKEALHMGATDFICSRDEASVQHLADTVQVDRVMECVGLSAAQTVALKIAGKGATVVLFGVSDEADLLPLSSYEAFTKELIIKTSFVNPHTTARAISILSSGMLNTQQLIKKVLSMEEAPQELRERRYIRTGKVLVRVDGEP